MENQDQNFIYVAFNALSATKKDSEYFGICKFNNDELGMKLHDEFVLFAMDNEIDLSAVQKQQYENLMDIKMTGYGLMYNYKSWYISCYLMLEMITKCIGGAITGELKIVDRKKENDKLKYLNGRNDHKIRDKGGL